MKDLFKLILGVLASLFKSRAKLEAEIREARATLPAPIFWPTNVETAIERPIAGIVTTCNMVDPTP
jgi:hypothetical protein